MGHDPRANEVPALFYTDNSTIWEIMSIEISAHLNIFDSFTLVHSLVQLWDFLSFEWFVVWGSRSSRKVWVFVGKMPSTFWILLFLWSILHSTQASSYYLNFAIWVNFMHHLSNVSNFCPFLNILSFKKKFQNTLLSFDSIVEFPGSFYFCITLVWF